MQQPHISLLIGGGGEQVMLKLMAQCADPCNVRGDPPTVAHKFGVLKQHCAAVGRDYEQIWRTVNTLCVIVDIDEQALAQVADMSAAQLGEAPRGSPETIRRRVAAYEAVACRD